MMQMSINVTRIKFKIEMKKCDEDFIKKSKKKNDLDDNRQKTISEEIKRRVHLKTIFTSLVQSCKEEYYEKYDDNDDARIAISFDSKRESKNHECLFLSSIKKSVKHDDDVAAEKQI